MRIPKEKAIGLIDDKITQFNDILNKATIQKAIDRKLHDEEYQQVYYGAEHLLTELFSREVAMEFRRSVTLGIYVAGSPSKKLQDFKNHIQGCIAQLKAYRERVENFWYTDEIETNTRKIPLPFVALSFEEKDQDLNNYFKDILDALQIEYETGERYSRDSISEKVKSRIQGCDILIGIFVKREETTEGKHKAPDWLAKELWLAEGFGKDVIPLIEEGIGDIAGLKSDREVISFNRDDLQKMQKTTIKFLEALKEHGLI